MKYGMVVGVFALGATLASAGAGEYSRIEADVSALPEANRFVGRLVAERVCERVPPSGAAGVFKVKFALDPNMAEDTATVRVKGAEAAAGAIFLARTGHGKVEIRDYITGEFGYDLSRSCDEIRPAYRHVESCRETVPEAVTAFLEGSGFEDVIRTAVSLGGDCDTLTCIAGSIAEAFYGIPEELAAACRARLPADMLAVLDRFEAHHEILVGITLVELHHHDPTSG